MTGLALIYSRISADPEGRQVGVQRQEDDCRTLAERYGYTVAGVYRENDVSASTSSRKPRPQFDAMVARVREGDVAAVLAYSNSRLTRRVREYLDLIELHNATGVAFRTVVSGDADLSTADGRAVALTLATWDAAEAERTSERVLRAKADARARGHYAGGPRPFGYEKDGTTIREIEAEAVRTATAALLDGESLGRIARDWNEAGLTTTRDRRQWTPAGVRRTIVRARNAGLVEHAGGYVAATWPALVTRERWEAACAIVSDPARRTNNGYRDPRWLLTGIAECGVCGDTMRHSITAGAAQYRCKAKSCTTRRQLLADEVVLGVIAERLRRDDARDLLDGADVDHTELADVRRQVAELEARLDGLATSGLSERMLAKRAAHLEAELDVAQTRLDALNRSQASRGPLGAIAGAADPAAAFLAADLDTQRSVLRTLATVCFLPTSKGRPKGWQPGQPYFDPASIAVEWVSA